MRQYGVKKTRTHIAGHQRCGICHPDQKNTKKRARRLGNHQNVNSDENCGRMTSDGEADADPTE